MSALASSSFLFCFDTKFYYDSIFTYETSLWEESAQGTSSCSGMAGSKSARLISLSFFFDKGANYSIFSSLFST